MLDRIWIIEEIRQKKKELRNKIVSKFLFSNIIRNILQDLLQRMKPVLEALQDLR